MQIAAWRERLSTTVGPYCRAVQIGCNAEAVSSVSAESPRRELTAPNGANCSGVDEETGLMPVRPTACYDLSQSRAAARERTPMKDVAVFS
jgi:hypothetical protein